MKAISLWQPWATPVVMGRKRYETRHWKTAYRGPLLIHAAKRWQADQKMLLDEWPFRQLLDGVPLPRGCILGRVNLTGCFLTENVLSRIAETECALGDWSRGRFCWRLEEAVLFRVPIPFRGSQGFFEVPDDLLTESD